MVKDDYFTCDDSEILNRDYMSLYRLVVNPGGYEKVYRKVITPGDVDKKRKAVEDTVLP